MMQSIATYLIAKEQHSPSEFKSLLNEYINTISEDTLKAISHHQEKSIKLTTLHRELHNKSREFFHKQKLISFHDEYYHYYEAHILHFKVQSEYVHHLILGKEPNMTATISSTFPTNHPQEQSFKEKHQTARPRKLSGRIIENQLHYQQADNTAISKILSEQTIDGITNLMNMYFKHYSPHINFIPMEITLDANAFTLPILGMEKLAKMLKVTQGIDLTFSPMTKEPQSIKPPTPPIPPKAKYYSHFPSEESTTETPKKHPRVFTNVFKAIMEWNKYDGEIELPYPEIDETILGNIPVTYVYINRESVVGISCIFNVDDEGTVAKFSTTCNVEEKDDSE